MHYKEKIDRVNRILCGIKEFRQKNCFFVYAGDRKEAVPTTFPCGLKILP